MPEVWESYTKPEEFFHQFDGPIIDNGEIEKNQHFFLLTFENILHNKNLKIKDRRDTNYWK